MRLFLAMTKALADETRVRALAALRGGELCLCQLVDLLGLAPSTVSKHLEVLHQAGLVERRKQGRWHYFRLAGRDAAPEVRACLRWALPAIGDEPRVKADARQLRCVRRKQLQEVSSCYREN